MSCQMCAYANCTCLHVLEDEHSSLGFIRGLTSESLRWDRDAGILGNTVLTFISFFVQHWYRTCLPLKYSSPGEVGHDAITF